VGLAESNGSQPPGLLLMLFITVLWFRSPAGRLLRTGISSGTLRSFRVWDNVYL